MTYFLLRVAVEVGVIQLRNGTLNGRIPGRLYLFRHMTSALSAFSYLILTASCRKICLIAEIPFRINSQR